jgi:hypothetical protein
MAWFKIVTNYRTFQVEAAGIGDAIERGLNLLLKEQGEYVREIVAA